MRVPTSKHLRLDRISFDAVIAPKKGTRFHVIENFIYFSSFLLGRYLIRVVINTILYIKIAFLYENFEVFMSVFIN